MESLINVLAKVKTLIEPFCNSMRETAKRTHICGKDFTDHTLLHAIMVLHQTMDVYAALVCLGILHDAERLKLCLFVAALLHDIGMAGNGCSRKGGSVLLQDDTSKGAVTDKQFKEIRKNHSLNSGLFVLELRTILHDIGLEDAEIDAVAVLCFMHSKSCSGVLNLDDRKEWADGLAVFQKAIQCYSEAHKNAVLTFHFSEKNVTKDIILCAYALRIGDVSRDSGPNAITLSGEIAHVVRESVNNSAKDIWEEIQNAVVWIGNTRLEADNVIGKTVNIGEQNIIKNRNYAENGRLVHEIFIADPNYAFFSTRKAIFDHLGELGTCPSIPVTLKLRACSNSKTGTEIYHALDKEPEFKYNSNVQLVLR